MDNLDEISSSAPSWWQSPLCRVRDLSWLNHRLFGGMLASISCRQLWLSFLHSLDHLTYCPLAYCWCSTYLWCWLWWFRSTTSLSLWWTRKPSRNTSHKPSTNVPSSSRRWSWFNYPKTRRPRNNKPSPKSGEVFDLVANRHHEKTQRGGRRREGRGMERHVTHRPSHVRHGHTLHVCSKTHPSALRPQTLL